MDSIIQSEKKCFYCGLTCTLHSHHIFFGNPNRSLSEKYGLKVWLCQEHHTGNSGVHFNKYRDNLLKDYAQQKAMDHYGWSVEDFINIFGKNYLIQEEK